MIHNAEFRRGSEEATAAIAVLQERWPAAFPSKGHLVRPLVTNLTTPIAEAMGWSKPYANAVLRRWKLRAAYCRAVLAYDHRVGLDGAVTDELVDDASRGQAQRQLAFQEARKRRNASSQRARKKAATTG